MTQGDHNEHSLVVGHAVISACRMAAGAAAMVLLWGCQSSAPSGPVTLAGTSWELVAIQSMDDAKGTSRIASPDHFTIRFETDGRANLRLDCNRGNTSWESTPSADGSSGRLLFGPVAATRALCAPPHLDERVARDLAYVRSYRFKDGKLYMSLMADGGIYEWRLARP